jgi:purine-binding chemotaxis protein CheW
MASNDGTQYVTLGVDDERFGIPVGNVREILDMRPISRLPHAPPHLLGVTDVRGQSVAVVDLRVRLGLPPAPATSSTRILVLEVAVDGRALLLGLMADRVFEVTELDGPLEPTPQSGCRWKSDHLTGIGRCGEHFIIVFDLDRLFAQDGPVLEDEAA